MAHVWLGQKLLECRVYEDVTNANNFQRRWGKVNEWRKQEYGKKGVSFVSKWKCPKASTPPHLTPPSITRTANGPALVMCKPTRTWHLGPIRPKERRDISGCGRSDIPPFRHKRGSQSHRLAPRCHLNNRERSDPHGERRREPERAKTADEEVNWPLEHGLPPDSWKRTNVPTVYGGVSRGFSTSPSSCPGKHSINVLTFKHCDDPVRLGAPWLGANTELLNTWKVRGALSGKQERLSTKNICKPSESYTFTLFTFLRKHYLGYVGLNVFICKAGLMCFFIPCL